jgi:hypothetical protein
MAGKWKFVNVESSGNAASKRSEWQMISEGFGALVQCGQNRWQKILLKEGGAIVGDLSLSVMNLLPYVLLIGFFILILRQQAKGGMVSVAADKNSHNTERIASCLDKHGEVLEAMLVELKAIRDVLEENRSR